MSNSGVATISWLVSAALVAQAVLVEVVPKGVQAVLDLVVATVVLGVEVLEV